MAGCTPTLTLHRWTLHLPCTWHSAPGTDVVMISTDENCDLERQRHPCQKRAGDRLDHPRSPRRRLPAGDQGKARPAATAPVRAGGLLVPLAWRWRVFGRGAVCEQRDRTAAAKLRPSAV